MTWNAHHETRSVVTDHKDEVNEQERAMLAELRRMLSNEQVGPDNPVKAEHMRRIKRCAQNLQDGEITITIRNGRIERIRQSALPNCIDFEY
jgi:hypothetical protein